MSIVDSVSFGLGSAEILGERSFLLSDGDHTLFEPATTNLYPDAADMLDRVNPIGIALVSANPDSVLAHERAEVIGADIVSIPNRKKWMKYGLFKAALDQAVADFDFGQVIVIGDRWLMDVAVAKFAAMRSGHSVQASLVRRPGEVSLTRVDSVLAPVEDFGFKVVSAVNATRFFRPDIEAVDEAA